ncbi:hypothetical protein BDZ97DRAFT_1915913 [Flammula alnicola]|nr:hypothetical protein BDZ97DRAFT_1915913 [Flammula alnicola]
MPRTTSAITSNSKEGGGMVDVVPGRLRPTMSAGRTTNSHLDSLEGAPVHGASPNNAELNDDRNIAESGLVRPVPPGHHNRLSHPQTSQRRAPFESTSLTGYLRTFGPKNGDRTSVLSGHHRLNNDERHTGAKGARPYTVHGSGPFRIDLNVDNYSYSRDTVGASVGSEDILSSTGRPRTRSPDDYRRSTSSSTRQWLNKVPEEMESGATAPTSLEERQNFADSQRDYGSVGRGTTNAADDALLYDEDNELSEEEEEWLLDEELAKQGLYRGNYINLLLLYTLVPLSSVLAFVLLALLPVFAFSSQSPSPFPYPPYLPFPLPEVFTATALWSLSYLLRDFLYATSLFNTSFITIPIHRYPTFLPALTSTISAILQSASTLFFRQLAVPILLIPHYSTERLGLLQPLFFGAQHADNVHKHHFPTWQDDAFRRVWWVALGWAAAEAVVGIKQGYESIALYKDVLVSVNKNASKARLMTELRSNRTDGGEQGGEQAGPGNNGPSPRSHTPVSRQVMDEDTNATPTQRDWEGRQRPFSARGGRDSSAVPTNLASTSRRRDHSDSLSSSNSNSRYDPVDDLRGSGTLGERQPLLNVGANANVLKRDSANDSDRLLAENEVERDLDELMALKSREELEEVYGIPVIRIPVFISCLHRINSILSSLGVCLLLTAAYMRSTLAFTSPPSGSFAPTFPSGPGSSQQALLAHPFRASNKMLIITLPILLALQALLTMMHTPWILPRIGIHTFVYVTLLVSLGLFFGGLGVWEALT